MYYILYIYKTLISVITTDFEDISENLRGQWVLIPDRHILVCKGDPLHPEAVQDVYLLSVPFLESLDDHKDYVHLGVLPIQEDTFESCKSTVSAPIVTNTNTPYKVSEMLLQNSLV